jgi:hypothetical protein
MVFDSDDPRVRGDEVALDESSLFYYNDKHYTGIESKTIYPPLQAVFAKKPTLVSQQFSFNKWGI